MHHQETVLAYAPAATTWGVLADLPAWPRWTASMTSVEIIEGEGLELGARVRIKQPKLPVAEWEVTELDPGRSFTWRATGPGVVTVATHVVEPAGDGQSSITLTIDQSGPLGTVVGFLFGGLTRRYVHMEAEGLARTAALAG